MRKIDLEGKSPEQGQYYVVRLVEEEVWLALLRCLRIAPISLGFFKIHARGIVEGWPAITKPKISIPWSFTNGLPLTVMKRWLLDNF